MAGILSTATTAAQYVIQACHGAQRLTQAVITFNCQIVGGMLRMLVDGCRALGVLSSLLLEVTAGVLLNILELVALFGHFFLLCVGLLANLSAWLLQNGGLLLSSLGVLLQWISLGLLHFLQYAYEQFLHACTASGLSSITPMTIKNFITGCLFSFYSYAWHATVVIGLSSYEFLSYIHQFISLMFCAIIGVVGDCWQSLYFFLLACFNLCASAIPSATSVLSLELSGHLSYEFRLTFLVTLVAVGLCMITARLLHKRGFTCPLFITSSNQTVHLEYNGDHEFLESDVDDAALDDEEEGEEEEEEEEEEEDSEISDADGDMDEYSIASSESETEDDPNAIRIHLPANSACSSLRSRSTPARSVSDNLSSSDLEMHLESERDKRMCVVCVDQLKTVLILPCKHMCLCIDCAREIAQSRFTERRVCPLCREPIETVMYIYV
ncbi:hypothetical protein CAPTEDRAFT_203966 [Capitella teleta]|uniref:RING-type domain-containing protein n=1 Tax=Capitella teleta TaxID=283909 RepID=R7V1V8_CAPTE|nr:hypothetical protein CAPTEDRAFT_203966 [Capitella teleta]|eukprot:ELU10311.1 hypothetical protein CAPTEDRAFT_203966 [Capitella teleta]